MSTHAQDSLLGPESTARRSRAAGSARRPVTGPAATLLAASAPRRYYMDGASKSDIAAEFGISRFKVARVLDGARSSGLVRIGLHYEGDIDLGLSMELGGRE